MVTGVNTNPLEPSEDMTTIVNDNRTSKRSAASGSSRRIAYWERAIHDVGKLKIEIEDLRKVTQPTNSYFFLPVFKIYSYT